MSTMTERLINSPISIYPGAVNWITDGVLHTGDMLWHKDREMVRPEVETRLTVTDGLKQTVEADGFRAVLLTSDLQVFEESERNKFCLYQSYTSRMESGSYIAYHVECVKDVDTGGGLMREFTLGLRKATVHDGKCAVWMFDQIRGYKNHRPRDTGLDKFVDQIINEVNQKESVG